MDTTCPPVCEEVSPKIGNSNNCCKKSIVNFWLCDNTVSVVSPPHCKHHNSLMTEHLTLFIAFDSLLCSIMISSLTLIINHHMV